MQRASRMGLAVLAATTVGLLLVGFWRMFGHFPGYDDEGYILISVRSYLEHGGLYEAVYSQYGPAFYVLLDGLHRLTGLAIDHEFARWFTLTLWFAAAAGLGAVVGRTTGSRPMAWFTWVAAFLYLYQLSEEAFHPGALVVALLPAAWGLMLELLRRGKTGAAAATAGAATAVLGLLKVNVGVLFAAGCVLWALLAMARRRGMAAWVIAGGVGFAAALFHGLLAERWVQVFLTVYAAGLAGLGAVVGADQRRNGRNAPGAPRPREDDAAHQGTEHGREWLDLFRWAAVFAVGAAVVVVVVVGAVVARGTTWAALVEGIILGPLRHADAYSFAVDWRPGTAVLALASVGALGWHRWLIQRGRDEAAGRLVVVMRLVQLAGLAGALALLGQFRVIGVLFSYALPWLWIWVVPLSSRSDAGRTGRELVACGLLLQALHAYPVGGIQICWGSFPLFALAAMAVPETAAWLERRSGAGRGAGAALVAVLALVAGGKAVLTGLDYREAYASQTALGLPGTGALRLSAREVVVYQALVANSVLHADNLFSLPGRFSFNLWSERPTPTRRNTTLWYSLLGPEDQNAIVESLGRSRRPAVIVDALLVSILTASGAPPSGPLYAHLLANYRPAFAVRGLGFWVRNGRTIAPVGTAWRGSGGAEGGGLRVCLLGTGEPIETLVLRDPDRAGAAEVVLGRHNAKVTVQPVDPAGRPTAAPQPAAWPLRFEGLAWVEWQSEALRGLAAEAAGLCELRTAEGRTAAAAVTVD